MWGIKRHNSLMERLRLSEPLDLTALGRGYGPSSYLSLKYQEEFSLVLLDVSGWIITFKGFLGRSPNAKEFYVKVDLRTQKAWLEEKT